MSLKMSIAKLNNVAHVVHKAFLEQLPLQPSQENNRDRNYS